MISGGFILSQVSRIKNNAKIVVICMICFVFTLDVVHGEEAASVTVTNVNYTFDLRSSKNRAYILLNELNRIPGVRCILDKENVVTIAYDDDIFTMNSHNSTLLTNGFPVEMSDTILLHKDGALIPLQGVMQVFDNVDYIDTQEKISITIKQRDFNARKVVEIDGTLVNSLAITIENRPDKFWGSVFYDRDVLRYNKNEIFSLPDQFLYKKQYALNEFSPYFWLDSLRQVCIYARKHGVDEVRPIIDYMMSYMSQFIEDDDGKLFLRYPVENVVYNKHFEKGWNSALGNAFVLFAAVDVYNTTQDLKYKIMADKLANAFLDIRKKGKSNWITFVDEKNFLWFEECPHIIEPQIRVLNGHIGSIESLHAYYLLTQRKEILRAIKAAITTVYYYIEGWQIPNNIHSYSLYTKAVPDYGQKRNLNQLETLYELTGMDYFLFWRSKFDNDYKNSGKKIQ